VATTVEPLYSGKLLREKTFANFAVLWLFVKVSPRNLEVGCPLAWEKRAIHESFLRENPILHQFAKVLPQKFPAIQYSLIPRPSHHPVFDCLQYVKSELDPRVYL